MESQLLSAWSLVTAGEGWKAMYKYGSSHVKGFAVVCQEEGLAFVGFDKKRALKLGEPCNAYCFDLHDDARQIANELRLEMPSLHFSIAPVMR